MYCKNCGKEMSLAEVGFSDSCSICLLEKNRSIDYKEHREIVRAFIGYFIEKLEDSKEYLKETYRAMRGDINRDIAEYMIVHKNWSKTKWDQKKNQ